MLRRQIHSIRKVRQQLCRLVPAVPGRGEGGRGDGRGGEGDACNEDDSAFAAFADVSPLHANPFSQPRWTRAVDAFTASEVAPRELRVASKIRDKLRTAETVQQVIVVATSS